MWMQDSHNRSDSTVMSEESRVFIPPQPVGYDHAGSRGQHQSPDVAQFQN